MERVEIWGRIGNRFAIRGCETAFALYLIMVATGCSSVPGPGGNELLSIDGSLIINGVQTSDPSAGATKSRAETKSIDEKISRF